MLVKGAAQQLADYMIKLSLKHYTKEWAFGLEYELWNEITGNQDILSDAEVERLVDLSNWCEGWITMSYAGGKENLEFLYLKEWERKFEKESPL